LGGLVVDVVIAYLIKSVLRLRRAWGSSKWPVVQAKVDSSWRDGGWVWNCPTAEVAYTYGFQGQTFSAIDSKPFFVEASVKERLERYRVGEAVRARVNPAQPQKSVLKQADQ
jgi:hypothetical protein